jgi:hypothetical protein
MEDELEQEKRDLEEATEIFNASSVGKPHLKVDMPAGISSGKSYSEREEETGQASDLVVTMRKLFPKFPYRKLEEVCSAIMVGRILHDSMLPRVRLTVNSIVRGWDDKEDGRMPPFSTILNLVTTAYEIGLGSKGREDAIVLHGSQAEEDRLEKLANTMI